MRLTLFRWLVISSIALALPAHGATRPRYGGTVRLETRAALRSLAPDKSSPSDSAARKSVLALIGDTLVALDANARPVPRLATKWQSESGNKRWQFTIRPGVFLHNGASLTPAHVAQSLAASNSSWKVQANSDTITVESELPMPNLPAELSRPEYVVLLRTPDQIIGTGPFRVADFQPGRRLLLRANDDYWNGRPYLDSVDIALNKPLREQAVDLQLGRADAVEAALDRPRAANEDTRRSVTSLPIELIALQFAHSTGASEDPRLRQAISLAIDRSTIYSVLLQRQGEPAAALLPQWLSGYSYLFNAGRDLARARELRSQITTGIVPVTLTYDPADELSRIIADRIALNARDAGIAMQVTPGATSADASLVRIPLRSTNAQSALSELLSAVDPAELPRVLSARSPEELFMAERSVLDQWRIVPIAQIPEPMTLSPRLRDWVEPREGGWPLANVWVEGTAK